MSQYPAPIEQRLLGTVAFVTVAAPAHPGFRNSRPVRHASFPCVAVFRISLTGAATGARSTRDSATTQSRCQRTCFLLREKYTQKKSDRPRPPIIALNLSSESDHIPRGLCLGPGEAEVMRLTLKSDQKRKASYDVQVTERIRGHNRVGA